jgi:hypothetical protein
MAPFVPQWWEKYSLLSPCKHEFLFLLQTQIWYTMIYFATFSGTPHLVRPVHDICCTKTWIGIHCNQTQWKAVLWFHWPNSSKDIFTNFWSKDRPFKACKHHLAEWWSSSCSEWNRDGRNSTWRSYLVKKVAVLSCLRKTKYSELWECTCNFKDGNYYY